MSFSSFSGPGRSPSAAFRSSVPAAAARFTLAALAASISCAGAVAQALPTVVVTASRFEEDLRQSLADITVIGREQIDRAGEASSIELLQRNGIEISQDGGRGGTGGIFLRGTKTAQSVVLVDGVRMQDPIFGGPGLELIPLASIERIEVLRGLSSTLYGSGAIGGVINVITRRPDGPPRAYGSLGLGTQGTRQASVGYGGALSERGSRFNIGASWDRTDGYEISSPGSFYAQPDRDGNRQTALNLNASQRLGERWQAGVDLYESRGERRYDDGTPDPELTVADYRSSSASAWLAGRPVVGLETTFRAGRTAIDYTYPPSPGFGQYAPRTRTDGLLWLNGYDTGVGRFTFGLEHETQRIAGEGVSTAAEPAPLDRRSIDSILGGWGQEWGPHQVRVQWRHDDIETVGAADSGSVAWAMRLAEDWRVRASAATAFRAPTFADLYLYREYSNPDLQPERARGVEAGLEWARGNSRIGATAFGSRIRDAIELDENFRPANLSSADVRGVTFDARHRLGPVGLRGVLTLQRARGEAPDSVTGEMVETPLARRANESGVIGADWRVERWTLWTDLIFQGDRVDTQGQRLAGYGVVSFGAAYPVTRDWQLSARLSNAGDRSYQTAYGFEAPPRALFVALRYQPR